MSLALPQDTHDSLRDEAKRFTQWEAFQNEMHRLAENVWHRSRQDSDHAANQPQDHVGDEPSATEGVESDESETNVVPTPEPEGGQDTTPAKPEPAPGATFVEDPQPPKTAAV